MDGGIHSSTSNVLGALSITYEEYLLYCLAVFSTKFSQRFHDIYYFHNKRNNNIMELMLEKAERLLWLLLAEDFSVFITK